MLIIYLFLALCLLLAAIYDGATHRIPNWLSLLLLLTGLSWNYFAGDGLGIKNSGTGLVVGLLLMLPGYIFGSMGAGDVKLMAAIGSVVGFDRVLEVVFYSYIFLLFGGVVFIIFKGGLFKALARYKAFFYGLFAGIISYQKPDRTEAAGQRLPLAPVIALASLYVLYPGTCNLRMIVDLCRF